MRGRCATILRMPGHRLCNHWGTPKSEIQTWTTRFDGWSDLGHPTAAFVEAQSLLFYELHPPVRRETPKRLQRKRLLVADTTKIEDTQERKKIKRAARKAAAPKAARTGPRGEKKKKVKKMARGVSKR